MEGSTWSLIAVVSVAVLAYAALIVTALIGVIRSRELTTASRVVWVAAIVAFPVFGTIAWYWIGHRTGDVENLLGIRPL